MAYNFDGPNKIIILSSGTTYVSVKDMYSRWKEWVVLGNNAAFLPAMSAIGADPLPGGQLGSTFFLENGWKIRPQEANHTLNLVGNLYSRDGSDPFVTTIGVWNVRIISTVSTLVETVSVGGVGTVQEVKDAVWGATNLISYGAGSAGEKLDSVGAASNPWLTDLTSYNTANTAGKVLKDAHSAAALAQTQTDTLESSMTTVLADTALIKGYTDTLESAVATVQTTVNGIPTVVQIRTEMDTNSTKLTDIAGYTDTLESAIAAIPAAPSVAAIRTEMDTNSTRLSTISGDLTTIKGYTDTLETSATSLQTTANTIAGYTDTLETSVGAIKAVTDTMPSAANIATAVRAELNAELVHVMQIPTTGSLTTQQATMILEMYNLMGLDPLKPLVVSKSGTYTGSRVAGTINQSITGDANQTTVTRL